MSEKIPGTESLPDPLVAHIYKLRQRINDLARFDLLGEVTDFDKKLKKDVIALYGSTRLLQEVSAWQALIGGSIEKEVSILPEQKEFVVEKIRAFVQLLEEQLQ